MDKNTVIRRFAERFGHTPEAVFAAPGRTEIAGNHTDHQRGEVIAAAVSMYTLCAASRRDDGVIRVSTEACGDFDIDTSCLRPIAEEEGTSASLVRGIAAELSLTGAGAELYFDAGVPGGSGLSSSACFEVLCAFALDRLLLGGKHTAPELAVMGQRAENVYYGKPCGLMDQLACAVGGVCRLDFEDPEKPKIERIDFDLAGAGYSMLLVDSGADHAGLTEDYAAIPREMRSVAALFGRDTLRGVTESSILSRLPGIRSACSDRAALRALHFAGESRRVPRQAAALRAGDMESFLTLFRESAASSAEYLQNIVPSRGEQSLMLTLAVCRELLGGRGAVRVHGGGFGGAAQVFVPTDEKASFLATLSRSLPEARVIELDFDKDGVREL